MEREGKYSTMIQGHALPELEPPIKENFNDYTVNTVSYVQSGVNYGH